MKDYRYKKIRKILLELYQNPQNDIENQYCIYLNGIRSLAYKNYAEVQYDLAQHYEDINILGSPNPFRNIKKNSIGIKKLHLIILHRHLII